MKRAAYFAAGFGLALIFAGLSAGAPGAAFVPLGALTLVVAIASASKPST